MNRPPRAYTMEFRQAALDRIKAGESRLAVAHALDVSTSLLDSWKKKIDSGQGFTDRKQYSDEFKRQAVARLTNETRSAIAIDLGINESMLSDWKKKFEMGKTITHAHKKKAPTKKTKFMRREYTPQFKAKAVARVKKGETQQAVADSLGIHGGMLSHWVRGMDGAPPVVATKKSYYIKAKDRVNPPLFSKGAPPDPNRRALAIQSCIAMLKKLQPQFNTSDVVHLTAALVLATLEGRM